MIGTLINAVTILLGSAIGLILHRNLSERITGNTFNAIGLFTIFLGVKMSWNTQYLLIMILSLVSGTIIGELCRFQKLVEKFGNYLKNLSGSRNDRFTEGMITAFLLFCMGSMTVLGAFEEGFGDPPVLLLTKSALDGFSSVALAASSGIGVMFSVIPLLIYQGGLTIFASKLKYFLSQPVINEMVAAGGVILIGLGIDILKLKKIRVINILPALPVALLLSYLYIELELFANLL